MLGNLIKKVVSTKIDKNVAKALDKMPIFKKGGKVKKTGPIYAHKGEFVLPKGIRPTRKQLMLVKKRR